MEKNWNEPLEENKDLKPRLGNSNISSCKIYMHYASCTCKKNHLFDEVFLTAHVSNAKKETPGMYQKVMIFCCYAYIVILITYSLGNVFSPLCVAEFEA